MGENEKRKPCVVGIGEVLLDCLGKDKKQEKLGGAPMIFAYHAAKSNCDSVIVSAIGNDDKGKKILKKLKRLHISSDYVKTIDKPTGSVEVDNEDLNDPKYNIMLNTAWTAIPFDDKLKKLAERTDAVYFGPLASYCGKTSKQTIDKFLDAVPKTCKKIFDVNIRRNPDKNGKYTQALYSNKLILEYLDKCNILKVNNEELEYLGRLLNLSKKGDREKCYAILNEHKNISILIVTMGRFGSSIYWRIDDKDVKDDKGNKKNKDSEIAFSSLGMPVNLNNTVGAGDALAGAFIGEILRGKTEIAAHQIAARRSALVCEAKHSMPPVKQHDIFISYSRNDEYIVAMIFCKLFEDWGFKLWRDKEKILHGDRFDKEIENAIKNSNTVVFFSSKHSNDSVYVKKEILFANENKKNIIPIKLDDAQYDKEINAVLRTIDHLDLYRLITSLNKQVYGKEYIGQNEQTKKA